VLPGATSHFRRKGFLISGLAAALVFGGASRSIRAAETSETPERLTESLIKLNAEHARVAGLAKSSIAVKMQNLALLRREALLARIAANPAAVLKAALPGPVSRRFPAGS